jgi:hypothetical protein
MKRFKNILYVVASSAECQNSLTCIVMLTENMQAGLTILTIVTPISAGIRIPEYEPISIELQNNLIMIYEQHLNALLNPYHCRIDVSSIVETIPHRAECAVLAIKPPGFITHVKL